MLGRVAGELGTPILLRAPSAPLLASRVIRGCAGPASSSRRHHMKPVYWMLSLLTATLAAGLWLWSVRQEDRGSGSHVGARKAPSSREAMSPPLAAGADSAPASTVTPEVSLEHQMARRLLALIHAESDPVSREQAAERGAKKIPRALLGAVMNWLQANPSEPGGELAMRGVMLRWAWEEPTGAAAWTLKSASGSFRREALGMIAAGWARLQPEALRQWADQLAPAERDWVMLHGASYLARTDLEQFASWQSALAPSRERDQLLAQGARLWAGRAPLEVVKLIAGSPAEADAEWRRHLALGLAGQLANVDDPSVVASAVAMLPAGPEHDTVLAGLVAGWSARDPDLVAAWLEGVTNQQLRSELSALLAGNWLHKDADAALAWMQKLPPGPVAEAVSKRAAQFAAAPAPP
jgi:hypothetical protein